MTAEVRAPRLADAGKEGAAIAPVLLVVDDEPSIRDFLSEEARRLLRM